MESLPEGIRARLDSTSLEGLVRAMATMVDGRQAGVPVSAIVGRLVAPCDLSGPNRARVYVVLRQAVRERMEAIEGLRYVPGSP